MQGERNWISNSRDRMAALWSIGTGKVCDKNRLRSLSVNDSFYPLFALAI